MDVIQSDVTAKCSFFCFQATLNGGLKFSANNEEEDNKTPWRRKSSSVKNVNDIMKNVKVNIILTLKVNVNVEYLVGVVSQ